MWIRHLLQGLAAEGRTVLVSSHLMSEMALMADHFVIIGQGRLIADVSTEELRSMAPPNFVTVRAERLDDLVAPLRQHGGTVESIEQGAVRVVGIDARAIGRIAASEGIALDALVPELGLRGPRDLGPDHADPLRDRGDRARALIARYSAEDAVFRECSTISSAERSFSSSHGLPK